MLKQWRVDATIPAADFERAKAWYKDKLDLVPTEDDPQGAWYQCGEGSGFTVYPSGFAGTGKQTVMGWQVPDLEVEMKELRDRGVTFEEYDLPELKTVDGVAELGPEKGCWFKDSEGNTLSLFQRGK